MRLLAALRTPASAVPEAWRVGWRADVLCFGLGLLSAFALPPFHAIPVLWLSVPGLLFLLGTARRRVGALRRGFFFGFGHHLVGLYWITEAILLESARYWWFVPIAVPALAAGMAVFIAVPAWAAWRTRAGWRRVVMFTGVWVLAELVRQYLGTGFPWNPWGSAWAVPGGFGDVMLQPAAWIGTPGLTLLTVFVAALPMLGWPGWGAAASILVVWGAAGLLRLRDSDPPDQGFAAVLVQGNVPQGQKWERTAALASFQRYLRLSAEGVKAAGDRPSVVIWPETASVFLLQSDPAARAAIAEAVAPAKGAIVGSITFTDGAPSRDPSNLPRNSLVAMGPDGAVAGIYDKWHLVPFGEYAPSWVPLAIQIVPGRFAFGQGPETLRIPGLPPFGPFICYEAIFPAQVVNEADRPDWLVNSTNDAWFGNSTGPRQHLAAARMRAVEEGLPLMRAANTGISAGFDSRGRELGRLGLGDTGFLVLEVPGKRMPTSFSRWGLVVPGLFALFMVGIVAIGPTRRVHRS